MYKFFFSFPDKHNILNRHQFGFRPKHSTTLSLIEVMDEIYKNLDNGYMSVGIFLDLQKAFDSVDHGILLDKLYHYGFRGLAHDWIGSYLQDRKQYVSLNGINSETENIVYGVPQGSVLGPLLFLIDVNDISNINPKLKIKLFADDTNMFLYNKNIYTLINDANKAMHDVSIWLRTNKLSLNVEKTNYCIFRNK